MDRGETAVLLDVEYDGRRGAEDGAGAGKVKVAKAAAGVLLDARGGAPPDPRRPWVDDDAAILDELVAGACKLAPPTELLYDMAVPPSPSPTSPIESFGVDLRALLDLRDVLTMCELRAAT